MRLLLDACLPQRLRFELAGHEVFTARFMGWDALSNGELLAVMRSERFAMLVTADSNLPHQQSIVEFGIVVVVLRAHSNRIADLRPLIPELLQSLPFLGGGVTVISAG